MWTLYRKPFLSLSALAVALGAGVGLLVMVADDGTPRAERPAVVRLETERRAQIAKVNRLLRRIDRKLAAREDRSEAPMRTAVIVVRQPSRVAASAPVTGIWSAQAERWRESWRTWADARLKREE